MRFSASLDWGVVARNVTTALVGPPTRACLHSDLPPPERQ